ncbi:hypothetical protein VX159_03730 [Dechloromonas sp. ZY10]|uniref:hypothetical protein n=1 Tax=Dechloromonas aquae TaxID=2664436 RepID=UPI0035298F21
MPQALTKLIAPLLSLIILLALLTVSVVALPFVLLFAVAAGGWFWWKTRQMRRQLQDALAAAQTAGPGHSGETTAAGQIIDGECIREPGAQEYLPRQP